MSTHDHKRCVRDALQAAARLCTERGVRLTPLRRRVLELVWSSHRPVGAYALLEMYRAEDRAAAPPTVYRALGFLLDQGLIHRIASLNAYVGCTAPGAPHGGQFLICSRCGEALELDSTRIQDAVARSAAGAGFAVDHQTIEVTGLCARCKEATA
ncbi:transcriptional repressor [Ectothiorhodospiraceae bacterium 2226]|nr:transcriptional repressor [Ectothiorhodospiraceae bacterium 2226]